MSTTTRVWVNGDLVDPTGPSVSALDHSVTVGDGVFETAKIAAGQPFALTRHHRRLGHRGCHRRLDGLRRQRRRDRR